MQNINNYPVFDSIQNLKILYISYNQFQSYLIFRNLPNLEKINLAYNKLQDIFGLSKCDKLSEIDCSND